ncbi:DMT family transporter [Saccharophagus degradans]|nr:DMT family transporter [Saccharophagus degradans]
MQHTIAILPAMLALLAGAAIAVQASLNAKLGVLIHHPLIATSVAFSCAALCAVAMVLITTRYYPPLHLIKSVPIYMWFSGGLLSAFGVGMFYFLIPKMGVGSLMSYALTGQIVIAIVASHFGWFGLPQATITATKACGMFALVGGIVLINWV